jgi:hypothetical protein
MDFNFEVSVSPTTRDLGKGHWDHLAKGTVEEFYVRLPHQCDEWVIGDSTSKDEVVAALQQFIDEAEEALIRLRALEPCDHDWEVAHSNGKPYPRCLKCDAKIYPPAGWTP